jgi:hypothetical protein
MLLAPSVPDVEMFGEAGEYVSMATTNLRRRTRATCCTCATIKPGEPICAPPLDRHIAYNIFRNAPEQGRLSHEVRDEGDGYEYANARPCSRHMARGGGR